MSEIKVITEFRDLDKSNQSYSTQRPLSASTHHSDGSRSDGSKQKPQFVIKKVSTEEVFKNLPKQNNLMGLSQINEENTADLDEVLPAHVVNGLKSPDDAKVSIFQSEMINASKYKEMKGPVYKEGNIVRHSIIGSADIFQRYERLQNKKAKENAEKGLLADIKAGKNIKQQNVSQEGGVSISFSDRPSTRGNFLQGRYSVLAEKKTPKNELKLSKDEIITEISKIKERQDISAKEEARSKKSRPLSSKLYLTKDERNLEKHQKTNDYWQRQVEDISNKLNREEGLSLMAISTEKFREKKELEEVLDIIQTDNERFGAKIWYHTLRRSHTSKPLVMGTSAILMPQTIEEILQTTQVQKQLASLEVIRKPNLVKSHAEANPVPDRPTSRSGDYLEKKLVERQHIVHELQPADLEDMQDLAVKGNSKLLLEAEAILRQAHKKEAVRVPKSFGERKAVKEEEVIVKGRTKAEILRNGLNVFLT